MWLLLIPTSGHTELCESEPGSAKDAEACGLMAAAVLLHKPFFEYFWQILQHGTVADICISIS